MDFQGNRRELGIKDTLLMAHELKEISTQSLLEEYAIYRVLIAFVLDMYIMKPDASYPPKARQKQLLIKGKFEEKDIDEYTKGIEDRFELFNSDMPFFQAPGPLEDFETKPKKSVAELFYHFPKGNNTLFFFHRPANENAVCPAACARGLCTIPPFIPSGGAGFPPGINGSPPWYVLILGKNLFQTIVINSYSKKPKDNSNNNNVAWRSKNPVELKKTKKEISSVLEGLTWQARYVRLFPERVPGGICTYTGKRSDILVREIVFMPGLKYDGNNWTDPFVAYRFKEVKNQEQRFSIKPTAGRAIWRDLGPLFLLEKRETTKSRFQKPIILENYCDNVAKILRDKNQVVFKIYGVRVDKAKIFEWEDNSIVLPKSIVIGRAYGNDVQKMIDKAESVASKLKWAIKKAYPTDKYKNPPDFWLTIANTFEQKFWNTLENNFWIEFILEIANIIENNSYDIAIKREKVKKLKENWVEKHLKRIAKEIYNEAIRNLAGRANMLKSIANSQIAFHAALKKIEATN